MVLPRRCVVCDSPDAELHSYVQEHIPLVVPLLAVHRRTPVVLPYCAAHAREFHRRFRILRNVQRAMVGIFFGGVIAAIVVEKQPAMSAVLPILIWASLISLFLLPITVVVRRFLYDAFFRHRGGGVEVSSSYAVFIERLREANGLAPAVAGPLPADLAPAVSARDARATARFIETTSAGNQLSSRGTLLPAVVMFIQAVVGICTGLTIVARGRPDVLAIAVSVVLNGFAVLVAWLLLRAARRRTVAGWRLGHWTMYLVGGYALGIAVALLTEFGHPPGR